MSTALVTEPDSAAPPLPRPFLKWAGGKGQLLRQFQPLLPASYGRYFEPFVGGAALFFSLQPERATLTDVNAELVDCYRAVRDSVEDVIGALGQHTYDEAHYYRVRDLDPASLSLSERAARTIFLNKTGFNGLYRVNSAGRFNVPFGRYVNPAICNRPQLRACSAALQGVELAVRDFERVIDHAEPGDFVYLDPPYSPVSSTANFTSYSAGGFSFRDQERLAALFAALDKKGVLVMLSNSDVPEIPPLYRKFRVDRVAALRSINAKSDARGRVGEIVIRNYTTRRSRKAAPADRAG
ncbi:DNA adenine methylase [Sorangium cellulosum]|uniref:Site-specific DNA-methyltransferase (adenine-specific) n=1 Tax=Sorangium cellulosum TaxID=56 RepID=A0A2L0ER31_SORCE|nr:DNA adenine methylase [Sorangium cellulosum]AUX41778.1 DNA adenine methylase [Sorangium cellulosum]